MIFCLTGPPSSPLQPAPSNPAGPCYPSTGWTRASTDDRGTARPVLGVEAQRAPRRTRIRTAATLDWCNENAAALARANDGATSDTTGTATSIEQSWRVSLGCAPLRRRSPGARQAVDGHGLGRRRHRAVASGARLAARGSAGSDGCAAPTPLSPSRPRTLSTFARVDAEIVPTNSPPCDRHHEKSEFRCRK